jgi:uncharacterized RmlC-like cupin family protein
MTITCNRCEGTGWLNAHQVPLNAEIEEWALSHTDHDVVICDCCGDGDTWYGEKGRHYSTDDPDGRYGPYAYNGGLCECH